jgi:hypothetical protein
MTRLSQIRHMSKELPRWVVSLIKGNKPAYITTVPAKDAESTIAHAVKEFNITDREQLKRLAARPE